MKGRRLVLFVCVIVLSFAGVGYSAWTEGLSIKSLFATGNIHVVFENPVIVNDGEYELLADVDEGVLDISGTVTSGTSIQVEYDILNDSSIPVKYFPDGEDLPEGITLEQKDSVIKPGDSLRGNKLIIEPGEDEIVLPFVQYNSSVRGGWKEELKICWNITVIEEAIIPELDMIVENGLSEEAPIESVTESDKPIEDVTSIEDVSESDEPTEDVTETEPPVTETTPEFEPTPDTDQISGDPASSPTEETPVSETPSVETDDENLSEENIEADEGSGENVSDGEE